MELTWKRFSFCKCLLSVSLVKDRQLLLWIEVCRYAGWSWCDMNGDSNAYETLTSRFPCGFLVIIHQLILLFVQRLPWKHQFRNSWRFWLYHMIFSSFPWYGITDYKQRSISNEVRQPFLSYINNYRCEMQIIVTYHWTEGCNPLCHVLFVYLISQKCLFPSPVILHLIYSYISYITPHY